MRTVAVSAVLVAACGKGSDPPAKHEPSSDEGVVAVPGTSGPVAALHTASGGADSPAFHLQPAEGTLTIAPAEGPAGTTATATLTVTPAAGFHVSTEFNIKLALETPPGVTLEKPVQTAGGRRKLQGDAQTLTEKQLVFAVRATAATPGSYEIKGRFDYGVCEGESCHVKNQPVTITVAAN